MSATLEATSIAAPGEAVPVVTPETQAGMSQPKAMAGLPFDPWRLPAALLHKWRIVLIAGVAVGGLVGLGGYLRLTAAYTASAQLMRQEPSATFRASELGELFKPRQLAKAEADLQAVKSVSVRQDLAENLKL